MNSKSQTNSQDTNHQMQGQQDRNHHSTTPSCQNAEDSTVSFCPSFSTYSNIQLTETAAKVIKEEERDKNSRELTDVNGDNDFAFDIETNDNQISPSFPLFNRDLLLNEDDVAPTIEVPLRKLFIDDDKDDALSSSSSEDEELDAAPPGSYCVWRPNLSPSPGRCEKSNSTGSSSKQPKWRLRDLLRRSRSDGKNSLILYRHVDDHVKEKEEKKRNDGVLRAKAKGKSKTVSSAHELFYTRKEESKRKSYLPYRQDIVGFFANGNNLHGLPKTFPPAL